MAIAGNDSKHRLGHRRCLLGAGWVPSGGLVTAGASSMQPQSPPVPARSQPAGPGPVAAGDGSMPAQSPQLPARFPLVLARPLDAGLVPAARLPPVQARLLLV